MQDDFARWISRFRAHSVRGLPPPPPNSGPTALKRKDSTMKRLAILTGILALAAPMAMAQTSAWATDPAHSEVDFTIRHGGVSNVHGRFGGVKGTLVYNEADITKATVTVTIDTTTVDTGEPARDTHLKTDAFFDVVKFPTATFTSSSVVKNGARLTVI